MGENSIKIFEEGLKEI